MQSTDFSSVNSKSKTFVSNDECNDQLSNSKVNNTFTTTKDGKLHDAMQELLARICELDTDEAEKTNRDRDKIKSFLPVNNMTSKEVSKRITTSDKNTNAIFKDNLEAYTTVSDKTVTNDKLSNSIERLQQKQSDVQRQLEKHLVIAKQLINKVTGGANAVSEICGAEKSKSYMIEEKNVEKQENEDADELAEFEQVEMQIDNELRISELNRQLDDIQEELRLKLFNQLLSNMNSSGKSNQAGSQGDREKVGNHLSSNCQSASSSSCSTDQPTNSSSTGNSRCNHPSTKVLNEYTKNVDVVDESGVDEYEQNIYSEPLSENQAQDGTVNANGEFLTNYTTEQNSYTITSNSNTPTNVQSDIDSAVDNVNGFVMMTPTTSKESVGSSSKKSPPNEVSINVSNNIIQSGNGQLETNIAPTSYAQYSTLTYPSSHRNSSVNSDLARIEEDEEDSQDYCSSGRFRTIYEEKFSPLINNGYTSDRVNLAKQEQSRPNNHLNMSSKFIEEDFANTTTTTVTQNKQNLNQAYASGIISGRGEYPSNIGSFTDTGNGSRRISGLNNSSVRPLTMYLPKPDEEIDLVDHIQALGHDIDIISADLKISSTSAQGYLWKCCSNNNKKWLKRYFFFDRTNKILSYFESKDHLVKRQCSPKSCIPFSEISDVYVDHKLSGIGQKERSSKRKNYVFVLATVARNYLLASTKAESMRAWIDVLFTAAKSNDYFQQLAAIESEEDEQKVN